MTAEDTVAQVVAVGIEDGNSPQAIARVILLRLGDRDAELVELRRQVKAARDLVDHWAAKPTRLMTWTEAAEILSLKLDGLS